MACDASEMQAQNGVAPMTGLLAVVATADALSAAPLGIPGSISGQATVVDGYPLARQGQAARALGAAFAASLFGGLFRAAVLTVALQAARPMILAFGTGELLLLGILGVTMVGVLSGRAIFRALTAAALGLLVGTVGIAPATGVYRFDFGLLYLGGGVPLAVGVVALVAIAETIDLMGRSGAIAERRTLAGGLGRGLREAFEHRWLIVRSSLIGTTVGMLPGIGGSVIDRIAYGHAVQSAKDRSRFGHGDIRRVIGPEAANDAEEGGALVPTMIFGIPGSGSTAVFMGGLILLGLEPGLTTVMQSQAVIYTVIWSLALANVLGAGLCIVLARPIASLAQVRFDFLAPVLLALLILAGSRQTGPGPTSGRFRGSGFSPGRWRATDCRARPSSSASCCRAGSSATSTRRSASVADRCSSGRSSSRSWRSARLRSTSASARRVRPSGSGGRGRTRSRASPRPGRCATRSG